MNEEQKKNCKKALLTCAKACAVSVGTCLINIVTIVCNPDIVNLIMSVFGK